MIKGVLEVLKTSSKTAAHCPRPVLPGRVRYMDIGRGAFAISVAGGSCWPPSEF